MPRKKAEQSEEKRDGKGRFLPGGAPKSPGRPAVARVFREWCQHVMDDGDGKPRREVILGMLDSDGEDRRFALKLVAEYAYGKPQQHVDVTSQGEVVKAYVGVDLDRV